MTDSEKLISLLSEWGVPFQVTPGSNDAGSKDINVFAGYGGFYTSFEFDASGKFIRMGAWE